MKTKLMLGAVAFALALGLTGVPGRATDKNTNSSNRDKLKPQTFVGEVMRNPDNRDWQDYLVYDTSRQSNFYLDDNWKVERYEGDRVRIKGTLDAKNNIIHVESIRRVDR